jgi:hypothetical protein
MLTLYRGCWPEFALGMSWTPDLAIARWFAHRFDIRGHVGCVYSLDVPRELVLGVFSTRAEHEVVVDAEALADYGLVPTLITDHALVSTER